MPSIPTTIESMGKRNIVGARVREARKLAKPPITQTDLIARLQVLGIAIDQSGLSKLESGQRPVSDIEVAGLAKALGVSILWLFEEANASLASQNCNETKMADINEPQAGLAIALS